jgi:FtsP/CotA-like multicopper oxidase with cupredoxin domain
MPAQPEDTTGLPRRQILTWGAIAGLGAGVAAATGWGGRLLKGKGLLSANGAFAATSTALGDLLFYTEVYPTSPLILHPFEDEMLIPRAMRPVDPVVVQGWRQPPGPGVGQQNSMGNETHQIWPSAIGFPDPIVYKIDLKVAPKAFTTSKVRPITSGGKPAPSFDANGNPRPVGAAQFLPVSTIYGFNGTFPGPMINAEYGKPVIVRFENRLHLNPFGLDRQDFGAPDFSFLTHLHNAHTAPESDGNPHYAMRFGPQHMGYRTRTFVDNLYLNWPAGGDNREKQSYFWFHDHAMDHTGANVYKGMVGLYPIYDPKRNYGGTTGGYDMGDERQGLHLPGVRHNHSDGSFDVDYDVPLAIFDARLDDGVTIHQDIHDGRGEYPNAHNPATHPEWWGKTFYKHFPSHGFVGDIFTVNGTAYPVMEVKRRKYRFRLLDASVARIYEFKLMSSTNGPKSSVSLGYKGDDLEGQYRIPDGQQCMKFTEIATDGGLLPAPITRSSFELWPAKRREVIIDFTQYQDGSPTSLGDEIYLTDVMRMRDGRMWDNSSRFSPDPAYKVPLMKFVIAEKGLAEDHSSIPTKMRSLPPLPSDWKDLVAGRSIFEVERGSAGGELEWLINGDPFDPFKVATSLKNDVGRSPLARPKKNSFNVWEIRNGGGGWVHPVHLHMEEHRTVMRNGVDVTKTPDRGHPDDVSREDVVALDPGESVLIYRGFRDFIGPYVAHCHNLAHEDHAMMFGWEIAP